MSGSAICLRGNASQLLRITYSDRSLDGVYNERHGTRAPRVRDGPRIRSSLHRSRREWRRRLDRWRLQRERNRQRRQQRCRQRQRLGQHDARRRTVLRTADVLQSRRQRGAQSCEQRRDHRRARRRRRLGQRPHADRLRARRGDGRRDNADANIHADQRLLLARLRSDRDAGARRRQRRGREWLRVHRRWRLPPAGLEPHVAEALRDVARQHRRVVSGRLPRDVERGDPLYGLAAR